MLRLIILIILSTFMMTGVSNACSSKNEPCSEKKEKGYYNYPNSLDRGYATKYKWHIANFRQDELNLANYTIKEDPTGTSPINIIEDFSPIKGSCGTAGHFWKENKVKIGEGTTDCNSNRLRLELAMNKDIRTGKKAKELWVSYYFYVPDTPDNFTDPLLQPYITQFYGSNKKSGQNRGGYAPQFSASIYNGKLSIGGTPAIDKENLKGKWHKVEWHVRYSKKMDGFVKVYVNDELKVNRTGFQTSKHSHVEIKYGSYSHPEYTNGVYPEGYQFSSHTIYFAKFSIANKRSKLLTSK